MADKSLNALTNAVVRLAEETQKSIKPDVKDIRNAVCGDEGIHSILMSMEKKMDKAEKRDKIARLTNRRPVTNISERTLLKNTSSINVLLGKILNQIQRGDRRLRPENMTGRNRLNAENFRRDNRRDRRGLDLTNSLNLVDQLKRVNLKDFIFAKTKIKHLGKIMSRALNTFKKFKDKDEVEGTVSFVNSAVDISKKLSKMILISKPAQLGAKAIEHIFIGKDKKKTGGLLGLFLKVSAYRKEIDHGKKSMKDILKSCGSMLLTTIVLTGIAAVAIPAMLGTLLMKGVVLLLIGTFKLLSISRRTIRKGSSALLMMSASVITFALGIGLMMKAVKGMKLKDVGMMMASIAGVGLTVAGVGLLAAPIALGSATLLLMGASLGIFGLAVMAWRNLDTKKSMGNIKMAIEGLREAFGFELGKSDNKKTPLQRLGGGIMDIAMGLLNFGSSFFIMGSLLLTGVALGFLYHGIKRWDNFNGTKAANNIKSTVGALKEVFGIDGNSKEKGGRLSRLGNGIMDMGITLFQSGTALAQMGTITIATAMADIIRVTLIPWNKYNAKPAATNLKVAIDALKDVFGLDKNMGSGFGKIDKLFGGALDMGITLMQSGKALAQIGVITLATGMADIIRLELKPWENYDASKPVANMGVAVGGLTTLFGLDGSNGQLGGGLKGAFSNMWDMGITLMQSGSTLAKMGTIALATGMLSKIQDHLKSWVDFDSKKPISNIKIAVDSLLETFGLSQIQRVENEAEKKDGWFKKGLKTLGNIITAPINMLSSAADAATNLAEGGAAMAKISNIVKATSALSLVKTAIEPWSNFDPTNALRNMSSAAVTLTTQITTIKGLDRNNKLFPYFASASKNIGDGLLSLARGFKGASIMKSAVVPLEKTVNTINAVDVTKASILIDVFKSFSKINNKQFDKFTNAVNKFSDSCHDLIQSLDKFGDNTATNTGEQTESQGTVSVSTGNVSINNTEALAQAIANAIKSLNFNVEASMPDVRLVVNNETGRKIILTLDN